MKQPTLEERVASLEQVVARWINDTCTTNPPADWWRRVGLFAGDEAMKRIDAAGQAIREQERQRARRRRTPAQHGRK